MSARSSAISPATNTPRRTSVLSEFKNDCSGDEAVLPRDVRRLQYVVPLVETTIVEGGRSPQVRTGELLATMVVFWSWSIAEENSLPMNLLPSESAITVPMGLAGVTTNTRI